MPESTDKFGGETPAQKQTIRPASTTRQGWEEQFRAMAAAGDDRLLDLEPPVLTEWEAGEWEW